MVRFMYEGYLGCCEEARYESQAWRGYSATGSGLCRR